MLVGHRDLLLMGDFYIKTSDLDNAPSGTPSRLYVYSKLTLRAGTSYKALPENEPVMPVEATVQKGFYVNLSRLTEAKSLNTCNMGKEHLDFMGAEAFEWT